MSVSAPFITRPIATSLLAIGILLSGLLGYRLLAISSLPQVDFPTVQVTTELPGANPDTMAVLVTASLERQFGQIPSLEAMTSTSSFGLSQITLQFALGRDIDAAAQDVQAAINAASANLPKNLPYPPTYSKVNPADTAIVTVALTSATVPVRDMADLADTLIAQRLAQVGGVGHVSVQGGIKPAVRVQADMGRLASYGLGLEDLRSAISAANVAGSKGSFDGKYQSYIIGANDQLGDAGAYAQVVVAYRNGAPVRLSDVATIVDDVENTKVGAWYEGRPAVVIDVLRQPGANIVQTVEGVLAVLPSLESALPADVRVDVVNDRTGTIRASVHDVQTTLIVSMVLVILVVFFFLRTVRVTLIAAVALPLSLVATFGVMWLCDFSLDNLSLMALTIGTGFVIDDAIVMIENIVRHIEKGEKPLAAAYKGAAEIGFTVISLTVSLVAVFIPLLFMSGIVGRLFREFALTLTIAVVVSAVVSLTLTPMMCSRLLKAAPPHEGTGFADRAFERMIGWYRVSLLRVMRHQALTLLVFLVTLGLTVLLYVMVPKGFLPSQDTGLISLVAEASQGASTVDMTRVQAKVADAVAQDPAVAGVVSLIGVSVANATPHTAQFSVTLKDADRRTATADEVIARLKDRLSDMPGLRFYFRSVQDIQIGTRVSRTQYQYTLIDTDGAELSLWSQRLARRLSAVPVLADVSSDLMEDGLGVQVSVDRLAAGRLGVTMQSVSDALYDAFGQRQVSTIYAQSNQYRVVLEVSPADQLDPASLGRLHVAGADSAQVRLDTVASIERRTMRLSVNHAGQFPAVTFSFNLAPGASLGTAVDAIHAAEQDIGMPDTITGSYSGDAKEFATSLEGEPFLILAATVVIYIVLGVLYESFIHPVTILSTLPSAGVGALLALQLTGQDLSIVALIGIVLLMGIVKKNAIMMIDFAIDAERVRGLSPYDAIVEACLLRFRPIMMTTAAALLGALPLVLESGTGAELRFPLGVTLIGGLLLSQVLTLYTTPVIYLGMEGLRRRLVRVPASRTASP